MKSIYALALASLIGVGANALELPEQISDHMVLQQNTDARLWGWAKPGEKITVTPSWNNVPSVAKTDKNGRWEIAVATPEASYTPYTLTFEGDGDKITISDVVAGEVWLAGGQSNMQFTLQGGGGCPIEGSNRTIADAEKYRGKIRVCNIPQLRTAEPQERVPGRWEECTRENAPHFSAIGHYFATNLWDLIDVPIGILHCSYGGTPVEGWAPKEVVEGYADIDMSKALDNANPEWSQPTVFYNAMLAPITPYTIKGFIFNQGESNWQRNTTYGAHLIDMVKAWRQAFGDTDDALPFYSVEVPPFIYDGPDGIQGSILREQQMMAMDSTANSGFVCSEDLQLPGEITQIHPAKKREVGERLAFMAAVRDYGVKGIDYRFPRYKNVELEGPTALVRFTNADDGFEPYFVEMKGFEVAGPDRVFHPAKAQPIHTGPELGIRVSSPEVEKVEAVRYCFHNYTEGNVRNLRGLPLHPFRTDNW